MRQHYLCRVMACALAAIAAPAHAGGLTAGRIDDTLADAQHAAADAQDVVNMVAYEDRVVIIPPQPQVVIPVQDVVLAPLAPEMSPITVQAANTDLVPIFVFGGLAGLPLLLGSLGAGGGGIGAPPAALVPGNPVGPGMPIIPVIPPISGIPGNPDGVPDILTPPPPAIPEPATWAMLLLGFGAVGSALRRTNGRRQPANAALTVGS
jgi:hypothetical protein